MKYTVIALSIFLLSSCSSVFYSQTQKIDLRSNGENNTEFLLYDQRGNIYPKPVNIRTTSTPGGMSLFIPKFSQFRYKSRFVPRVNYLLAKKNESNKVYKVNYRMRYDGSRFEPYATFGITSTAAAALTVATIPIALATDGGILIPAVFALFSAAGVIYVDLPTGIISEIYSWILSRQGVYRKWKFVSIQELDPIDYPDFLSSYRFEEGEFSSSTEKKNRPSNRMKRLVSTYNQKVKSNDSAGSDVNMDSKSQEIPDRNFSFSEVAEDSTNNEANLNLIDSSFNTSTLTKAVPSLIIPNLFAVALDKSIILSFAYGPRSFTFTIIERPFFKFVTLTTLGKGRILCAAVNLFISKTPPFAVGFA